MLAVGMRFLGGRAGRGRRSPAACFGKCEAEILENGSIRARVDSTGAVEVVSSIGGGSRALSIGLVSMLVAVAAPPGVAQANVNLCPAPTGQVVFCIDNFRSAMPLVPAPAGSPFAATVEAWNYEFPHPAGGVFVAPCTVIGWDLDPPGPSPNDYQTDPCLQVLGATRVSRLLFLGPVAFEHPASGPLEPVGYFVTANLDLHVAGFGIENQPIPVVCRESDCSLYP